MLSASAMAYRFWLRLYEAQRAPPKCQNSSNKKLVTQIDARVSFTCSVSYSIAPVRLTSPVPSVRHNWERHINIHSKHILIDYVFSAQINRISSWRACSCRSNSMLYINISASLTSSASSEVLKLCMEIYWETNILHWQVWMQIS